MEKHGYGPAEGLAVKVADPQHCQYRDPAIILIDQMKEIYIDGVLDTVETANWFPKIARKDYMVGANLSGSGVDDPDAYFFSTTPAARSAITRITAIRSSRKCMRSNGSSPNKKTQQLVWGIDRRLQEDAPARSSSKLARGAADSHGSRGHNDGQQPVQWMAVRGCLARPIALAAAVGTPSITRT